MTERERCKRLYILLQKLYNENDADSIELIKTFVENDTPSIKKSYEIMLNPTSIASFFGVEKLADLKLKKEN